MSDMTKAEVGQLLNLDYFFHARVHTRQLVPDDETLRIPLLRVYAAEEFESLLWLILGAQYGFFPGRAALTVYESFHQSLLPRVKENRAHLVSLFPVDDFLVNLLVAPNSFQKIKELIAKEIPTNTAQLSLLRSSLLLGSEIAADSNLRIYTALVHFASDAFWTDVILTPLVDPDEIMKFLSGNDLESSLFSPDVVCAGLTQAINYMSRFDSIFREIGSELNDQGVPDLRQRVRAIIGWRVGASVQKQRFLDLIEKIGRELDSALQTNHHGSSAEPLRAGVIALMKYWNGEDQLLTMHAR